jgi:hypothetical protein
MLFFEMNSAALLTILVVIVMGATVAGWLIGRSLREHDPRLREPLGVIQAALLGLVGLILAFGLTMAVGRYDTRRAAVVDDANAIGTTYLRAQTLREPIRSKSLDLLRRYTDSVITYSEAVPGSDAELAAIDEAERLQRELWSRAGVAIRDRPTDSAPRLYIETLNEMIDMETVRVSALNNRVPSTVLAIEVVGAAVALGLLALYIGVMARGITPVLVAAAFVAILLFITFDLDRPTRGLIRVPDTPLTNLRASMDQAPAATAGSS